MRLVMRPYVMTGAALAGAGLIAVSSIAPPPPSASRIADAAVRLAGIENLPWNLFAALANIPYQEFAAPYNIEDNVAGYLNYTLGPDAPPDTQGAIQYDGLTYMPATSDGALNEFLDSMNYTGNWWLLDSTNILGTDFGDPPKYQALADLASMMFPEAGKLIGYNVSNVAIAELPTDPECPALSLGGCPNPIPILSHMFTVSTQQLEQGYTFDQPWNQVSAIPNPEQVPPGFSWFTPIPVQVAGEQPPEFPWAGTTFTFDPQAPLTAIWDYLTGPQAEIHTVTAQEVFGTLARVGPTLVDSFNPFVEGTYCPVCLPFMPGGLETLTDALKAIFGVGGAEAAFTPAIDEFLPGIGAPDVAEVLPSL